MKFTRSLFAAALATTLCAPALAADLAPTVNQPTTEGTVYHCRTEIHGGNEYRICSKIGTTNPSAEPTPADLAELAAVEAAFLLVQPVLPRANWLDGGGMIEYCRGSVHGDCSGACRITAVLPDGSVIVECGER